MKVWFTDKNTGLKKTMKQYLQNTTTVSRYDTYTGLKIMLELKRNTTFLLLVAMTKYLNIARLIQKGNFQFRVSTQQL